MSKSFFKQTVKLFNRGRFTQRMVNLLAALIGHVDALLPLDLGVMGLLDSGAFLLRAVPGHRPGEL